MTIPLFLLGYQQNIYSAGTNKELATNAQWISYSGINNVQIQYQLESKWGKYYGLGQGRAADHPCPLSYAFALFRFNTLKRLFHLVSIFFQGLLNWNTNTVQSLQHNRRIIISFSNKTIQNLFGIKNLEV